MLRSTKLALAVATAATAFATPVLADSPEYVAFGCGFASTNDPSGVVNQDPNVQTGELDCGPVVAADLLNDVEPGLSPHPGTAHIKICGWIQVNNSAYGSPAGPSAQVCAEGDGVAYGAGVITYTAAATDNVFLCSEVVITHDSGSETIQWDEDDNAANGNQCSLAISAGA